ncbi:MAG TPA: Gfo/Idh/MocA family oxidoreductase [Solirubrobacterales bacterium]|nr:Gfo/Idh/MocA family oxidoreductase [Solirubrobacterales bacterium]
MSGTAEIGFGMVGYGFMGRAHAVALGRLAELGQAPVVRVGLAGRDRAGREAAAARLGFDRTYADWRALLADPSLTLLDNVGPNDVHAEPAIAAAAAGINLLCEKPLGRDPAESLEMARSAARAGVVHMCGFNYRFLPAIRLARELLEAGELGEVRHFRAAYLQDWALDPTLVSWRFQRARAGSGALGDLGSHLVDLGRYLLGAEVSAVSGRLSTFLARRGEIEVDVDDAFAATIEFEGGALGTLEASRLCPGRANSLRFEVVGERGSLAFDLERLSELELYLPGAEPALTGPRRVLTPATGQPFAELWWPNGHLIGWEHSFIHQMIHLLQAVRGGGAIRPHGADFEDGYRAAVICGAIAASAAAGARLEPVYEAI